MIYFTTVSILVGPIKDLFNTIPFRFLLPPCHDGLHPNIIVGGIH